MKHISLLIFQPLLHYKFMAMFTSTAMIIIAAFFLIVELEGRLAREWTPIPKLFIGGRSNQSGSRIPPMQSLAIGYIVPFPSRRMIGDSWSKNISNMQDFLVRFSISRHEQNMSPIEKLRGNLTCPAVKIATLRSLCPRKARLLVGKLFSCSALPVARSKIQYLTQLPVFSTAWTPRRWRNITGLNYKFKEI